MAQIIEVTLKGGRKAWSGCCIVAASDRGTLMFTPSERANRNFFRFAMAEATKLFGDRPTIVVPPRFEFDDENRPWLPPIRIVGEFNSSAIGAGDLSFSCAVLIWYQRQMFPQVDEGVIEDLAQLDWEKVAIDERIDL